MSPGTFQVILDGRTLAAQDVSEVANRLATLFKTTSERIAPLLAGKAVVIRRGLDEQSAQRYQAAIERAGAACHVEAETLDLDLPIPVPERVPSPSTSDKVAESLSSGSAHGASGESKDRASLSPYWQGIFAIFDRAGGANSTALKQLPKEDARKVFFHIWAMLFGVFWYIAKGMWSRGLTLLFWTASAFGAVEILLAVAHLGEIPRGAYYASGVLFAVYAKADYYRYLTDRKVNWPSLLISFAIFVFVAIGAVLLEDNPNALTAFGLSGKPPDSFLNAPLELADGLPSPPNRQLPVSVETFLSRAIAPDTKSAWRKIDKDSYLLTLRAVDKVTGKLTEIQLVMALAPMRTNPARSWVVITRVLIDGAEYSGYENVGLYVMLQTAYRERVARETNSQPKQPPRPPQSTAAAAPVPPRTSSQPQEPLSCVEEKIAAHRKAIGEDALITNDVLEEFTISCAN